MERKEDLCGLERHVKMAVEQCISMRDSYASLLEQIFQRDEYADYDAPEAVDGVTSLHNLFTSLGQLGKAAERTRHDQALLQSLHFRNLETRHNKIESAHGTTFERIFESPFPFKDGHKKSGFKDWFETGNGLFWIYGKPGSGKSSLMKFISDRATTSEHLRVWAGTKGLSTAKFFFWNSGSALQKSQEGLLRALLFEILRQCPDVMVTAHELAERKGDSSYDDMAWTVEKLLRIYTEVVGGNLDRKFCIFIDGIDEFQAQTGADQDLLHRLRRLNYSSDIKLCVSSRPWTTSDDEFREDGLDQLKLDDLTRGDIRRYVNGKLQAHPQFLMLTAVGADPSRLVDSVTERAQGAFLWVLLAVRTLLEGLTYQDSFSTLQRRLEKFPPDLDAFFQHILDTVDPIYRRHTARCFTLATTTDEPLPAMMYSFLDELGDDPGFAFTAEHINMQTETIADRQNQLRQRLKERTCGLLEVKNWQDCKRAPESIVMNSFYTFKVDFLHRTVRDFLASSHETSVYFKKILGDEDVSFTACHAVLAEMKTAPFNKDDRDRFMELIERLFFFASTVTSTPPDSVQKVLDEAEKVYQASTHRYGWAQNPTLLLGLAAQVGLVPYVTKVLTDNPGLLRRPNVHPHRPLLHYALHIHNPRYDYQVSLPCLALLLDHGADPNGVDGHAGMWGNSVWSVFLADILQRAWKPEQGHLYDTIKLLLEHGAEWEAPTPSGDVLACDVIELMLTPPVATQLITRVKAVLENRETTGGGGAVEAPSKGGDSDVPRAVRHEKPEKEASNKGFRFLLGRKLGGASRRGSSEP